MFRSPRGIIIRASLWEYNFLVRLKDVSYNVLGLETPWVTAVVTSTAIQPFQKTPPQLTPIHTVIPRYDKSLFGIILLTMPQYEDVS
jgi:hypothetical protein